MRVIVVSVLHLRTTKHKLLPELIGYHFDNKTIVSMFSRISIVEIV